MLKLNKKEIVVPSLVVVQKKLWLLYGLFGIVMLRRRENVVFQHHKAGLIRGLKTIIENEDPMTNSANFWLRLGNLGADYGYNALSLNEDVVNMLLLDNSEAGEDLLAALDGDARYSDEFAKQPTGPTINGNRPVISRDPDREKWWWYILRWLLLKHAALFNYWH